ncbi:MAG TPA: hypothetical protein VFU55_02910 [Terracidiphilus sp.]|nr:hypothetical protein [Terracidiphilus sp.]
MAGFAVFMTIATFGVFGFLAASALSACLYFLARRTVRKESLHGHRLKAVSIIAPFLGLLWLVIAFLIHVQISNRIAHQDCGLSGDPYVTLPNGYVVGSLNTYDGYLAAPGFNTGMPVVGPGYVRSIIDLHYSDPYFTGTLFDFKASSVRSFIFDTRSRAIKLSEPIGQNVHSFGYVNSAGMDAWSAANDEAQTGANSYWRIYARYRHHWPTYVLVLMILAGEGTIAFWVWKTWKNTSTRSPADS